VPFYSSKWQYKKGNNKTQTGYALIYQLGTMFVELLMKHKHKLKFEYKNSVRYKL